jgi:hypothetical protein
MGNSNSKPTESNNTKFNNFYEVIDFIASNYILTMNFESLANLSQKDYCNNLVIITSDIIKNHFNDAEISYLSQRIKNGVEVNEMEKKNVVYFNKNILDSLDASNDRLKSIKKKRMCIGIAKFYVKIAHIFAAIVTTINPVYSYKDQNGNLIKTPLLKKNTIPKNIPRTIEKYNICDNRIRSLKNGMDINYEDSSKVKLNPKICSLNLDKNTGNSKTLYDEPGIKELLNLYLDDEYDYSDGKFKGMSPVTKKKFNVDLKLFYTSFTGNKDMPSSITKFSDIKLKDYKQSNECAPEGILKIPTVVDKSSELFKKYAKNINNMINNAANNQQKLLNVINSIFSIVLDPYTKKKVVRINPKLNEKLLNEITEISRKFIINLYVKCEMDYINGIKIYEAIVEQQILETTKNQIHNLKKRSETIVSESKKNIDLNMKNNQPVPIKPPSVLNDGQNFKDEINNIQIENKNTLSHSESGKLNDSNQLMENFKEQINDLNDKPEEPVALAKPEEPVALAKPEEPVVKPEEPVAKPEEPEALAKPEEPVAKPEEPVALAKPVNEPDDTVYETNDTNQNSDNSVLNEKTNITTPNEQSPAIDKPISKPNSEIYKINIPNLQTQGNKGNEPIINIPSTSS